MPPPLSVSRSCGLATGASNTRRSPPGRRGRDSLSRMKVAYGVQSFPHGSPLGVIPLDVRGELVANAWPVWDRNLAVVHREAHLLQFEPQG